MQELINRLIQEAGLTAEQASRTLQITVDVVKSKLPAPIGAQVEQWFRGEPIAAAKEASFMEKAGDLAEEAKDKLEDMAEKAKDKLEDMAGQAKEKFGDMAEEAREKLGEAAEKAEDFARDAMDKVKGLFGGKKPDA